MGRGQLWGRDEVTAVMASSPFGRVEFKMHQRPRGMFSRLLDQ